MTDVRPMRICDACGGVDDHPRHVIAYADGDGVTPNDIATRAVELAGPLGSTDMILQQITDTSTMMYHMDCCRERGCPDGTCYKVTAGAEDLKGDKLVAHLTKGK